ncbi:MAG: hypothetical protein AAFY70_09930 [Bacteroidota bacterium]
MLAKIKRVHLVRLDSIPVHRKYGRQASGDSMRKALDRRKKKTVYFMLQAFEMPSR